MSFFQMGTHAIKILLEIYFVKDNLCLYSNIQKALEISIYLGIKIQCAEKIHPSFMGNIT